MRPTRRSPARRFVRQRGPACRSSRRQVGRIRQPVEATRTAAGEISSSRPTSARTREGDPSEIGHAEQVQARRRVDPVRVHRNDVRVLEPGQCLGLSRTPAGDLQRHRPVGELPLAGQENPGEGASAQLLDQVEPADGLADLGKHGPVGSAAAGETETDEPANLSRIETVADPISR